MSSVKHTSNAPLHSGPEAPHFDREKDLLEGLTRKLWSWATFCASERWSWSSYVQVREFGGFLSNPWLRSWSGIQCSRRPLSFWECANWWSPWVDLVAQPTRKHSCIQVPYLYLNFLFYFLLFRALHPQVIERLVGSPPTSITFRLDHQGHREIDHIRDFESEPMFQQREMVIRYTNAAGVQRFKGGADLKSSQAYPKRFLEFINMFLFQPIFALSFVNSDFYRLPILASQLRFGVALAKVRTRFAKINKRKAMSFLRDARKGSYAYDMRPRTNHAWMKAGDLQSVLDFLTQKTL